MPSWSSFGQSQFWIGWISQLWLVRFTNIFSFPLRGNSPSYRLVICNPCIPFLLYGGFNGAFLLTVSRITCCQIHKYNLFLMSNIPPSAKWSIWRRGAQLWEVFHHCNKFLYVKRFCGSVVNCHFYHQFKSIISLVSGEAVDQMSTGSNWRMRPRKTTSSKKMPHSYGRKTS